MQITRAADIDDGLLPAALAATRRVPEEIWTHREQQRLHPRTSYARALHKVVNAWLDVFGHLDQLSAELRFDRPVTASKSVVASYTTLLRALNEHIESRASRSWDAWPPRLEALAIGMTRWRRNRSCRA